MTVAGSRRRVNHRGQPDLVADGGEFGIPVTRREAGSMWDSRFEIRDSVGSMVQMALVHLDEKDSQW